MSFLDSASMRAVLVPVKAFAQAKLRLHVVLDQQMRRRLAMALASIVLDAAHDVPRYVVCDDNEVAEWAIGHGAQVLWTPGLGLSGAVSAGVEHLGRIGFDYVTVAHGDLPLVRSLERIGDEGEVTLAPDRRLDGTNVASVPSRAGFRFAYGPGSFARHRREAERLQLPLRIVHDSRLACDVDIPSDLDLVTDLVESLRRELAKLATIPLTEEIAPR